MSTVMPRSRARSWTELPSRWTSSSRAWERACSRLGPAPRPLVIGVRRRSLLAPQARDQRTLWPPARRAREPLLLQGGGTSRPSLQDAVVVVSRARLQARFQRIQNAANSILADQLVVGGAGTGRAPGACRPRRRSRRALRRRSSSPRLRPCRSPGRCRRPRSRARTPSSRRGRRANKGPV